MRRILWLFVAIAIASITLSLGYHASTGVPSPLWAHAVIGLVLSWWWDNIWDHLHRPTERSEVQK